MKTIQKKEKWTCGYCEKSGTERKFMEQHHCSNPVKPLSQKEPEEWEKEFDKNVNYDEAELGCNWSQDDIKSFIRKVLSQQRTQTIEEIKKEITATHKELYDELEGTFGDSYSIDYKHGVLRGYTLIGRYFDSLK